ncbi:MAG: hypothetical protein SWE60_26420 [Thermodesulfobacteriota bacterium]|nr:hypothetical protein [Thermodesulfobacteriota bacterium]
MTKETHLKEADLLKALVDETDLPALSREHLKTCHLCRSEKDRLELALAELGHRAERFAPSPRRKVALPVHESAARALSWDWNWRRTLVAGMVTAVAAIIVVYGAISFKDVQEAKLAALTQEIWEDDLFMTEVSALSENALPLFCSEVSGESYPDFDEEFMDFVVPSTETDLVSRNGGGVVC